MNKFVFDMQKPQTGKTEGLMMKAISEALLAGGKPVLFVDHCKQASKEIYKQYFLPRAEQIISMLGYMMEVYIADHHNGLFFRSTVGLELNRNERYQHRFRMQFEDDAVFHVDHSVTMKKYSEISKKYPEVSGVILQNKEDGERVVIDQGAVRYIKHKEFHDLLHPSDVPCDYCGKLEKPGEDGGTMIHKNLHVRCHHELLTGDE